jgi:ABC-2 type transport system permease protein
VIAYTRFEVLRVLHNIRYLVFLVVMPVAFSLIWAKEGPGVMVAMAVYAVCGGALLGSGNTIAEDRLTGCCGSCARLRCRTKRGSAARSCRAC